ncbi:MAG: hypothetical protein M1816_005905 [Peltula sp. TS41687]|nr:MAG: hypothetical protein M1816_005905 [Peltula sp. TS41687]
MDNDQSTVSNLADPILLNKVDHLFTCGAGAHIALPQLVVVGDQSSGKSSFATQIVFRRTQETNISVSIIPAENASPEHAAVVQGWSKADLKSLDAKSFAEIMIEVHVSGQHAAYGGGTFSEDVLRLEICGPEQEHFSVVDVPGIFRKATGGVITKADSEMVRFMVRNYMENLRSVILTVIPANVDIATQEILTMAEEVDDGHRTLGVLTKQRSLLWIDYYMFGFVPGQDPDDV